MSLVLTYGAISVEDDSGIFLAEGGTDQIGLEGYTDYEETVDAVLSLSTVSLNTASTVEQPRSTLLVDPYLPGVEALPPAVPLNPEAPPPGVEYTLPALVEAALAAPHADSVVVAEGAESAASAYVPNLVAVVHRFAEVESSAPTPGVDVTQFGVVEASAAALLAGAESEAPTAAALYSAPVPHVETVVHRPAELEAELAAAGIASVAEYASLSAAAHGGNVAAAPTTLSAALAGLLTHARVQPVSEAVSWEIAIPGVIQAPPEAADIRFSARTPGAAVEVAALVELHITAARAESAVKPAAAQIVWAMPRANVETTAAQVGMTFSVFNPEVSVSGGGGSIVVTPLRIDTIVRAGRTVRLRAYPDRPLFILMEGGGTIGQENGYAFLLEEREEASTAVVTPEVARATFEILRAFGSIEVSEWRTFYIRRQSRIYTVELR